MTIVGISIVYPVAPYVVRRYSDEALMVTMLTVIYAAAQFFAAPVLGKLGDRYGQRPVLLVSVFGSPIGYVIFGLGGALWVLSLSRLIDGVTSGNMSIASAYFAYVSRPAERARSASGARAARYGLAPHYDMSYRTNQPVVSSAARSLSFRA